MGDRVLDVLGWFLLGMFIWGCCIVMEAFQNRFAPALNGGGGKKRRRKHRKRGKNMDFGGIANEMFGGEDPKDKEIRQLRERLEVLEAIVTDRRFQWEQDYRTDRPR
jgi:hypothetical protein